MNSTRVGVAPLAAGRTSLSFSAIQRLRAERSCASPGRCRGAASREHAAAVNGMIILFGPFVLAVGGWLLVPGHADTSTTQGEGTRK